MNITTKALAFACGFLIVLNGAAANADTVTQTFNVPAQPGAMGSGVTFFTFQAQPFDPALGTLDSVGFDVEVNGEFSGEARQSGPTSGFINLTGGANLSAAGSVFTGGGLTLVQVDGNLGEQLAGEFTFSLTGANLTSGGLFVAAEGGSPFTFDLVGTLAGSNDNIEINDSSTASITFNFTPTTVPEPGSAGLLAVGLMLAGIKRRRK